MYPPLLHVRTCAALSDDGLQNDARSLGLEFGLKLGLGLGLELGRGLKLGLELRLN